MLVGLVPAKVRKRKFVFFFFLFDRFSSRTVTDKSLPYCGQIGVYAECDIRVGTYIGEYCGQVFVCDGQSESL
jgi:hypothetical protein